MSRGLEIADRFESLKDLLAVSDVVSLHCPLTDETREMINAATIKQMKRDAILINTARGAIVDIRALVDALRNGDIAGAGIDVLPIEPPPSGDALAIAYRNRADPMVGERLIVTPLVESRERQRRSQAGSGNGDASICARAGCAISST